MRPLKLTDEVKSILLARATWIRCSVREEELRNTQISLLASYKNEYNSVGYISDVKRCELFIYPNWQKHK